MDYYTSGLIAFFVILSLVLFIVLILVLVLRKPCPSINSVCQNSSECGTGLTCDRTKVCKVPPRGKCNSSSDCANNGVCNSNHVCVPRIIRPQNQSRKIKKKCLTCDSSKNLKKSKFSNVIPITKVTTPPPPPNPSMNMKITQLPPIEVITLKEPIRIDIKQDVKKEIKKEVQKETKKVTFNDPVDDIIFDSRGFDKDEFILDQPSYETSPEVTEISHKKDEPKSQMQVRSPIKRYALCKYSNDEIVMISPPMDPNIVDVCKYQQDQLLLLLDNFDLMTIQNGIFINYKSKISMDSIINYQNTVYGRSNGVIYKLDAQNETTFNWIESTFPVNIINWSVTLDGECLWLQTVNKGYLCFNNSWKEEIIRDYRIYGHSSDVYITIDQEIGIGILSTNDSKIYDIYDGVFTDKGLVGINKQQVKDGVRCARYINKELYYIVNRCI